MERRVSLLRPPGHGCAGQPGAASRNRFGVEAGGLHGTCVLQLLGGADSSAGVARVRAGGLLNEMNWRIIATGQVLPVAHEILGRFGQIEVASHTDEESLIARMDGAIALIVRGLVPISARLIDSAAALRVIGRTGAGFENVD